MDPAFLRRFDVVLEMPLLRGRQRERLLDEACGDLIDATTRTRLIEARGLTPAVVRRAARVVRTILDVLPANRTSAILEQLIESTLEAQGHGGLSTGEAAALTGTTAEIPGASVVELEGEFTGTVNGTQVFTTQRLGG